MPATDRNAMLAKIHIARKALCWDDDTYRDVLERVTGKRSAGDLSDRQLHQVIAELKAKGWKDRKPGRNAARDGQSRKIRALWLTLADAGAVRNRSESALRAYAKRITGLDDLRFADSHQKNAVIESLKDWCKREGVGS